MKSFKSTTIKSIIGSSKLVIEVPHQRQTLLYDTNYKLTDTVDSSGNKFRDKLRDLSHYFICKNLGDLKDAHDNTLGHQRHKRQFIIKQWCKEHLTGSQYLWLFEERKSCQY